MSFLFPNLPCMEKAYSDKTRRYTGQQPGTKAAVVPLTNSFLAAGQPWVFFLHRFALGFLCLCFRGSFRILSSMLWGATGSVVS